MRIRSEPWSPVGAVSIRPSSATFPVRVEEAPENDAPAERELGPAGTPPPEWFHPFEGATSAQSGVRRALDRGVGCIAVTGPDGIGKTRLLHELGGRIQRRFRIVHLPLAALPPNELMAWALGQLGMELAGDPAQQLLRELENEDELPLVLAIDEANAMPAATARQLARWVEAAGGNLRIVLALSPDDRAPRVRSSFGANLVEVAFERPLTPKEGRSFLEARIRLGDPLPSQLARFDAATLDALYSTAAGIPGHLLELVGQILKAGNEPSTPSFRLQKDFDPFAVTSTVDGYVPRPATERALTEVMELLDNGIQVVGVTGPPGLGKTQILRVLADRVAGKFHPLNVSYGSLEPAELERWIGSLLGTAAGTPSVANAARDAAASGTPLLLLVDDAGSIPPASLQWLHQEAVDARGALRLVFAGTDVGHLRPLEALDGLSPAVRLVSLTTPLDADETEALVHAQLRTSAAPEPLRDAFDARSLTEMHAAAEGNPADLQRLADERVRDLGGLPAMRRRKTTPSDAVKAIRPKAFDPVAVSQPRWLAGGRIWVVLGVITALTAALLVLPLLLEANAPSAAQSTAAGTVRVHINASPWAEVSVDGKGLGVTPLGNIELEVGSHQLSATLSDGSVVEREIFVDENNRHIIVNP